MTRAWNQKSLFDNITAAHYKFIMPKASNALCAARAPPRPTDRLAMIDLRAPLCESCTNNHCESIFHPLALRWRRIFFLFSRKPPAAAHSMTCRSVIWRCKLPMINLIKSSRACVNSVENFASTTINVKWLTCAKNTVSSLIFFKYIWYFITQNCYLVRCAHKNGHRNSHFICTCAYSRFWFGLNFSDKSL